jgi:hypothetical protein
MAKLVDAPEATLGHLRQAHRASVPAASSCTTAAVNTVASSSGTIDLPPFGITEYMWVYVYVLEVRSILLYLSSSPLR